MTEWWSLARKDLALLLRDRAGFFFTFFWPVIMAMFFGSIFGGGGSGRDIEVLVVDRDQTEWSEQLVQALRDTEGLAVSMAASEVARESVRLGAVAAAIEIPEGFGAANQSRFTAGAPRVILVADPSRRAERGLLEGRLVQAGASLLQKSFTDRDALDRMVNDNLAAMDAGPDFEGRTQVEDLLGSLRALVDATSSPGSEGAAAPGFGSGGALQPLEVTSEAVEVRRRGPSNPFAISFAQAMLWAVLGCSASFGVSLAIERSLGTLIRLRCAPLRAVDILAGKALACFATALAMCGFLIGLGRLAFGVQPLSWPLLALAVTCTALCFVGIMMLLSVMGRTERAAAGIGWGILLLLAMFGGGMVPLFIMPSWMVALSHLSPVKWGILAIEGAVWRGFTLAEMAQPCLILLAVGAVTFAVGAKLFDWGDLG